MSDTQTQTVSATVPFGVGFGVFWFVWGVHGFFWALLYGAFWPLWVGYRVAALFLAGQ